jgi:hypothetical protein
MGHETISMLFAELRGSKRERIVGTIVASVLCLVVLTTSIVGIWYLGHHWGIW